MNKFSLYEDTPAPIATDNTSEFINQIDNNKPINNAIDKDIIVVDKKKLYWAIAFGCSEVLLIVDKLNIKQENIQNIVCEPTGRYVIFYWK